MEKGTFTLKFTNNSASKSNFLENETPRVIKSGRQKIISLLNQFLSFPLKLPQA